MDEQDTPVENMRRIDSTKGPVVATFIIVIVLLLGAVVVFYNQYQQSREWQEGFEAAGSSMPTGNDPFSTPTTSTSTAIQDIEEDLSQADFSDLENEITLLEIVSE